MDIKQRLNTLYARKQLTIAELERRKLLFPNQKQVLQQEYTKAIRLIEKQMMDWLRVDLMNSPKNGAIMNRILSNIEIEKNALKQISEHVGILEKNKNNMRSGSALSPRNLKRELNKRNSLISQNKKHLEQLEKNLKFLHGQFNKFITPTRSAQPPAYPNYVPHTNEVVRPPRSFYRHMYRYGINARGVRLKTPT